MYSSQPKILMNSLNLFHAQKNLHLKFYEIMDETKIFHIWPCSKFLAIYIYNFPEKFQGKKIIELGSGVGVLGLVKFSIYFI